MLTGSLDAIANYVGFAITLFAGTAVAAVFVLRAREPNAPRPFKALGYPWTPAIFVLVSAAIVVNAFYSDSAREPDGLAASFWQGYRCTTSSPERTDGWWLVDGG